MRIAFGSVMHESNTFNKLHTGLESFNLADGEDFKQVNMWKGSVTDGIYNTLTEAGAHVVPLFFARAIPAGTIRRDAYEYIKSRMIDKIKNSGPLDGICLALHGSMAVDGLFDPEGDLLEAIRWEVGHDIPIVCALDMHATVTERMIVLSDGFSAYRTAPHIDSAETGKRAAEILLTSLKEKRKTVNAFVKIPILVSGEQSETRVDPAKTLFDSLFDYDALPHVLCSSYVMGFPWADSPFGGAGAIVTGWEDDHNMLKETAKEMAQKFWDRRADFVYSTTAMTPDEAIDCALSHDEYPVIISDSGDNPGAGASQDTTCFLRLMIDRDVKNAVYTCVSDPDAYRVCAGHKANERFKLTFGGCYSGKSEERLTIDVTLISLKEFQGVLYAVLNVKDVKFLISNKRCGTNNSEVLKNLGYPAEQFNLVAVKAGYLNPGFQDISKLSILALTEGDTALDLKKLPYVKTMRPMYPLDQDMVF
ncbi:MAG: M81 family metallopeptidase [Clostridiales bacterium]|jgi:microcystin degradation protein MlrC|nr:M81 family metallopeptidase [Clostridiales bacterium]